MFANTWLFIVHHSFHKVNYIDLARAKCEAPVINLLFKSNKIVIHKSVNFREDSYDFCGKD